MESVFPTRSAKAKGLLSFGSVVCLALAFMVFAWGTNYKLSLYKAEHQSSPAKVCTRGSDAFKNALHDAVDVECHAALSTAILFSVFQETESYPKNWLSNEVDIALMPLHSAPILYLRPPPYEHFSFA